MTTTCFWL